MNQIYYKPNEFAKSRAHRALRAPVHSVPFMFRAPVPSVSFKSRSPVPSVPFKSRAPMPSVPFTSRAPMPSVPPCKYERNRGARKLNARNKDARNLTLGEN